MPGPPPSEPSAPVDLTTGAGAGPLWGTASEELNATLLAWPAGEGVAEHVNEERDVLMVVIAGSCAVAIDGRPHSLSAGAMVLIEKGRPRAIVAGAEGVRYLSVHRRRPPLQLADARRSTAPAEE